MKQILPIAMLFLLGCIYSNAQTPVQIDPQTAVQHLINQPPVEYPAIARAARIEGTVLLVAGIDENGRVAQEAVVVGPPMLQYVALHGVGQFTYSPFLENGKRVPVTTVIGIRFALNGRPASFPGFVSVLKSFKIDNGMKQRADFLISYMACNRQAQQGTATSEAVKLCQDAVQKAEALPANTSGLRAAYVDYATALLHDGKPGAAIDPGDRAIAANKGNSYDPAGASAAYAVTAEALALTGNLQEADKDFSTAEKYAHKAIGPKTPASALREQRSQVLKSMLEYHAKILTKMGKQEEAQKKLKEAAKI